LGAAGATAFARALSAAPAASVASTPPPPHASSVAPSPTFVVASTTAHLGEEDRAELRAMIRDELARERSTSESGGDDGSGKDETRASKPALSEAQREALDHVRAEVDRGVATGAWTPADRASLRASLDALPVEMWSEAVRPLFMAANAGKLRIESHGPLF
jgi:hypothetical protein